MKKVSLTEAVDILAKGTSKARTNHTYIKFTREDAQAIAKELDIDFRKVKFSLEEFHEGINTELEHGTITPDTNVTDDNPIATGKIALAHLNESPYYYDENIGIEAWEEAIKTLKGSPRGKKLKIL